MAGTLGSLLAIARMPVRDDVRASLKRSWEGLPPGSSARPVPERAVSAGTA